MEEITKRLLEKRGIRSEEDIEEFLSSKPKRTFSYKDLPDMEEGLDLILSEIKKNHKIMIYGDYDCDGITATSLMYEALSSITDESNISYYIPNRMSEGYSLNMDAVNNIHNMGYDFIITVDCGSTSFEEVEYAKSLGLKILVTDHHNITDRMANTLVINPKRPDSKYEFKDLSGCGVAFKVVQGLVQRKAVKHEILTKVLDLVAIGTIGDIMPLVSENRTLVKYGLRVIESGNRLGLRSLIEKASLDINDISGYKVGYIIVPHLNASGRLDDASIAVRLMLTKDKEESDDIASKLVLMNLERKHLQEEAFNLGIEKLADNNSKFIFLRLDESHEGILGIVAGKIKETYYRPTVILTMIDDEKRILKGTGRSIDGVDLYTMFNKYSNLFLKFGGHTTACGFSILEENVEKLMSSIEEEMEKLPIDTFVRKDNFDLEVDEEDLSLDLAKELEYFEPFGKGNEKPKFKVKVDIKDIIYMGQDNKHFKFINKDIQYLLFNKASEYEKEDLIGKEKEVIGEFNVKYFRGIPNLQFIIDEIR